VRFGEADQAPRAVDLDLALGHIGSRHCRRVARRAVFVSPGVRLLAQLALFGSTGKFAG
jgi:hypothetical protein